MFFSQVVRLFKKGNVCVTGLRGTGKDVLFGNVIARRKAPYISNLNYGGKFILADFNRLNCGGNLYKNFLNGDILEYDYPYPIGADVYVSDSGIYFPSQYQAELVKKYGSMATHQALTRQVSENNFHINTQNLSRCWDKIREQSDTYIRCRWCKVIFGIVFQGIRIYDKAESCQKRVRPCRVRAPLFNKEAQINALIYRDNFFNTHGEVKDRLLVYRNKSNHDTLYFGRLLGVKK